MLTSQRHRAAVLGSPISHSLSPVLHRAAHRALGLDWRYDAIDVDEAGLPGFLDGLDTSWAGLSLTMPLKEAVLPLLDEVSELARATRSANTVVFLQGWRRGHNTDVYGIVAAVREVVGQDSFRSACIIGAGATARSAVAAAQALGARQAVVVARRPAAAAAVLQCAGALGLAASTVEWSAVGPAMTADLVISTVPGDAAASLVPDVPVTPGLLLDVTYRPWPTSLAAAWSGSGGATVAGSTMLLWQAARQVELMTGMSAPVAAMRAALDAAVGGP